MSYERDLIYIDLGEPLDKVTAASVAPLIESMQRRLNRHADSIAQITADVAEIRDELAAITARLSALVERSS